MTSTRTTARRRRALGAVAVVVGLGLGGCATGTPDDRPAADPGDPCAGGAPVRNELDAPSDLEESPELVAAQDELGSLALDAERLAGDRLGGVWLAWTPQPHVVVEVTEGPAITDLDALATESGLVEVLYTGTISRTDLQDAVAGAHERIATTHLPSMGSYVDELNGRWVLIVPSGDDGGAATCTGFRELLAGLDIPFAFEVVDAPEDSTQRGPVRITEARLTYEGREQLQLVVASCNGDPQVTVLEQTDAHVRAEVTSTTPAPGWAGEDCLDAIEVTLDAPLGDRSLVDVSTGAPVPVEDS